MKHQLVVSLGIILMLSVIVWSCVDVNNSNVPSSINYRSLIRFVNLAGDAPSSGTVSVDGSSVGSISYGGSTAYLDLPAGSRTLGYSGASQLVSFASDGQFTVVVHSLSGTDRFLRLDEGYTFKSNSVGLADTTQIRFVNSAVGFAPNLIFREDSLTGTDVAGSVAFLRNQPYTLVGAGSHTYYAISNGGYTATIEGGQSVPPVTTTSAGTAALTLGYDEGLAYSITVTSDNTGGYNDAIYLAAHFHVGGPTVNGPVEEPIDISKQQINFPDAAFARADTFTQASASASGMNLTANAARDTFYYAYSITVTADPTDTLKILSTFDGAEFRTGAPGTNGPVVRTIATGPFRDTTISDTWSTGDAQPLTKALVDSLLKGRVYIALRTPRHVNGELRLQLAPEPASTNTYTGTWSSISDALRDSVVAGSIYINFHTTNNPVGQIRGRLVVDPAKGQYAVTSIPATNFATGQLYTIVAADSTATNMTLLTLTDRIGSPSKVAAGTAAGSSTETSKK